MPAKRVTKGTKPAAKAKSGSRGRSRRKKDEDGKDFYYYVYVYNQSGSQHLSSAVIHFEPRESGIEEPADQTATGLPQPCFFTTGGRYDVEVSCTGYQPDAKLRKNVYDGAPPLYFYLVPV